MNLHTLTRGCCFQCYSVAELLDIFNLSTTAEDGLEAEQFNALCPALLQQVCIRDQLRFLKNFEPAAASEVDRAKLICAAKCFLWVRPLALSSGNVGCGHTSGSGTGFTPSPNLVTKPMVGCLFCCGKCCCPEDFSLVCPLQKH